MDVEKPEVPPATLFGTLIVCILGGAAAAGIAAASLRTTTSMRGRHGNGKLDLKFSLNRSILYGKYRTSKFGDFLRVILGIGILSLAYTLKCKFTKTVTFSIPFSEEGIPVSVPTLSGFSQDPLNTFFLILVLVGIIILVREFMQHLLAWLLDAEVGAVIDKTSSVFTLGSGIFGHPFGSPQRSIIWEDLSPRVKGFICLGNILSLFSLLAFFYYVSSVWFADASWVVLVEGVAIPVVAMTLMYSTLPFVGGEGTVIFEWNKTIAISLLVIAGFMYFAVTLHGFDTLPLQYALGMVAFTCSAVLIGGLLFHKFMEWINLV